MDTDQGYHPSDYQRSRLVARLHETKAMQLTSTQITAAQLTATQRHPPTPCPVRQGAAHRAAAFSIAALCLFGCNKSTTSAPEASATASAQAPIELPPSTRPAAISGRTESGWTDGKQHWLKEFDFEFTASDSDGRSWGEARQTCQDAGKDLCSDDQWQLACKTLASVGKLQSWTLSATAAGWVVRGGRGCGSTQASTGNAGVPERIGLCCDARAAVTSSGNRQAAVMGAAQTYIENVERAAKSRSARETSKLLADRVKFYKTQMTREEAERDTDGDLAKWSQSDVRLVRCDTDVPKANGWFECDAVGTRTRTCDSAPEVAAFRVRFEYEDFKYVVWADPLRVTKPWAPL